MIRHIKHEIWHNHVFDYLFLATAAVFFVLSMRLFSGEKTMQMLLVIAFAGFYIIWGMYHHIISKTMRIKIMLEYVLVGVSVLFFLLTIALR